MSTQPRVVLVTGASSGIGAAAAAQLARAGFRVVLLARRAEALRALAAQLPHDPIVAPCDASDGEAVRALAARLGGEVGPVEVVVNSAGAGTWKYVEDTTPAEALAMLDTPYRAAFHTASAFLPEMLAHKRGLLVHINSPACFFPWPSSAGYTASRWALRGLHESLCQDLVGTGVQSCHVVVGEVASPYFEHNPGTRERVPRIARLIRVLTPDECGQLVARVVARPRREVIHPPLLRVFVGTHHVAPRLVSGLLRRAGYRRPS